MNTTTQAFETPCTCASFERETDSLCPGCEEASREKFRHDMADAADEHERIMRERQRQRLDDDTIGVDWFYGGD